MTPEEDQYLRGAAQRIRARQPDIAQEELNTGLAKLLKARRQKQAAMQQPQQPQAQEQSAFTKPVVADLGDSLSQFAEKDSKKGTAFLNEAVKAGDVVEAQKAQITDAALRGKQLPRMSPGSRAPGAGAAKLFADYVAAPLWSGAEAVMNVVDTPDRVWREFVTANEQGRDSELLNAATMTGNRGNTEDYLQATRDRKTLLSKGVRAAGTGLGAIASLYNPGMLVEPAVSGSFDNVADAGALLTSPTSFVGAGAGGSRQGISRVLRAVKKSGGVADKAAEAKIGQMLEQLAEKGPTAVAELKAYYKSLGGKDEVLDAIAGPNLERVSAGRYKIGVPLAQEKYGVELSPSRAINAVTGANLPEDILGRAAEKLASTKALGGLGLPKWSREMVLAERTKAVNRARAEVASKTQETLEQARNPAQLELQPSKTPTQWPLSATAAANVAPQVGPQMGLKPVANPIQTPLLSDEAALRMLEPMGEQLPLQKLAKPHQGPLSQPALDPFPKEQTLLSFAESAAPKPAGGLADIPPPSKKGAAFDFPTPKPVPTFTQRLRPQRIEPEIPPTQIQTAPDAPKFGSKLPKQQTMLNVADHEREAMSALHSGAKAKALEAFESHIRQHIPNVSDEVLEAGKMAFGEMSAAQKGMLGPITRIFKEVRLHGNPAWALLNAVEDSGKMFLAGMSDPRVFVTAQSALKGTEATPMLKSPGGTTYTRKMLQDVFRDADALNLEAASGRFGADTLSKVESAIATAGSLGLNKATKKVEAFREGLFKRAFLVDRLQRGFSPNQAINDLGRVLFNMNVRPTTKTGARLFDQARDIAPFIGYTVRSAKTVPRLLAKQPGRAMIPVRATQAMQSQSEDQYLPKEHMRNSAAYYNLPPEQKELVRKAIEFGYGGELNPGYGITLKRRGTAFDPFSSMASASGMAGSDEAWGQVHPLLQLPARAAFDVGPHGQKGKGPTWLQAAGTLGISTPTQRLIDLFHRRFFGGEAPLTGYPVDYYDRKGFPIDTIPQREIMGLMNAFSPYPLGITSPLDVKQEEAWSDEVQDASERVKTFKTKARRL